MLETARSFDALRRPWPLFRGAAAALCLVACSPTAPTPPSSDEEPPLAYPEGVGGARAPITLPTGSGASAQSSDDPANPWLQGVGASGPASGGADSATGGAPSGSGAVSSGGELQTAGAGTGGEPAPPEVPPELLITQYFEGKGADKALELTNVGAAPAQLASCELSVYTNGSPNPYRTTVLNGVLLPGESLVLCSSAFATEHAALCASTLSSLIYNGNDAIVLRCLGAVSDRVGRVGEDPGAAWSGTASTKDANLLRRCTVAEGDPFPDAPFLPDEEWESSPLTELSDLGARHCPAPGGEGAGGAEP